MHPNIAILQAEIKSTRQAIVQHPLYARIQTINDLHVFMEHHVYAVWDFMSLLKGLQQQLTCTQVPWFPVGDANTRFLINEIVVGEESDIDEDGVRMSHFELYLKAMKQAGANTSSIETFVQALQAGQSMEQAFELAQTPASARAFVRYTFAVIQSQSAANMASVFTFGREDLIPDMFMAMVRDIHREHPEKVSTFLYYLERHIEVDGDHHSHLALAMTEQLCGNDASTWTMATQYALNGLQHRQQLWDGVLGRLQQD